MLNSIEKSKSRPHEIEIKRLETILAKAYLIVVRETHSMEVPNKPRSKAFVSMDSLWYEEERLDTFIDWPVPFISCAELAREGFYYLRTKDHCACAFCRGIIGAWDEGDTPKGEHKRHFPHCPFVQGKVTPNVPISQGSILARASREISSSIQTKGEDVCGLGIPKKNTIAACPEERAIVKSSNTELSMSNFGFRQYCGPKSKEYLTTDVRLNSFKHWPEKVKQTPLELAEAGFYYCGLSDHVRCFHCGNGLRNWDPEDNPWEEHARWFPECHFVLLKKGIEFVDKVRRERPPYIPTRNKPCSPGASTSGGKSSYDLTNEEMEKLMELGIIKHVLEMGFSKYAVKSALKKRVMESGQPFYSVETCIDAVLLVMDEETKNTIQGCEDITSQARKMAAFEASTSASSSNSQTVTQVEGGPEEAAASMPLPPLPNNNVPFNPTSIPQPLPPPSPSPSPQAPLPSPPQTLPPLPRASSPPLRASTPTSHTDTPPQSMEVEVLNETMEQSTSPSGSEDSTSSDVEPEAPPVSTTHSQESSHMPSELPREVIPLISEADDAMEEAEKLLAPSTSSPSISSAPSTSSSSSSSPSSSASNSAESSLEYVKEPELTTSKEAKTEVEMKPTKVLVSGAPPTEDIAQELERIRENRMCKVCMDKEMDVVFLPCTHMVACSSCVVALAACPICRRDIQFAFKPIIS